MPLVVRPAEHGLQVAWSTTLAYVPSAHTTQLLPKRRYPSGQEQCLKVLSLPRPTFTIAASVQVQLPTPTDPLDDTLRSGQLVQLADPSDPWPYWLAAQSTQASPADTVPIGHSQGWLASPASTGTLPSAQTHWLTLDAPVVLVVRPAAHATHVLSLVSDW